MLATVKSAAIFTAPSISTTSRLVVPSTSISPLISNEANVPTPVVVNEVAPSLTKISAAAAVINTSAEPLKFKALSELELSETFLVKVVPLEV